MKGPREGRVFVEDSAEGVGRRRKGRRTSTLRERSRRGQFIVLEMHVDSWRSPGLPGGERGRKSQFKVLRDKRLGGSWMSSGQKGC